MYARVFAAARAVGRSSRTRLADLLIASTAAADGLPLYTRAPADFNPLKRILKIVKIKSRRLGGAYSHSMVAGGLPVMS